MICYMMQLATECYQYTCQRATALMEKKRKKIKPMLKPMIRPFLAPVFLASFR